MDDNDHEHEPEIRRIDEAEIERRSLAQTIGEHALEGGATGFAGTIGVLAAKDVYAKAKKVLHPSGDNEPPPTSTDNE